MSELEGGLGVVGVCWLVGFDAAVSRWRHSVQRGDTISVGGGDPATNLEIAASALRTHTVGRNDRFVRKATYLSISLCPWDDISRIRIKSTWAYSVTEKLWRRYT